MRRVEWLVKELQSRRPLVPPAMPLTDEVKEVRFMDFRIDSQRERIGIANTAAAAVCIVDPAPTPGKLCTDILGLGQCTPDLMH